MAWSLGTAGTAAARTRRSTGWGLGNHTAGADRKTESSQATTSVDAPRASALTEFARQSCRATPDTQVKRRNPYRHEGTLPARPRMSPGPQPRTRIAREVQRPSPRLECFQVQPWAATNTSHFVHPCRDPVLCACHTVQTRPSGNLSSTAKQKPRRAPSPRPCYF